MGAVDAPLVMLALTVTAGVFESPQAPSPSSLPQHFHACRSNTTDHGDHNSTNPHVYYRCLTAALPPCWGEAPSPGACTPSWTFGPAARGRYMRLRLPHLHLPQTH